MDEPVDHGCGDDVVGEDLAPAAEGHVRGHQHCALFVAGGDELKEQVRGVEVERDVADLDTHGAELLFQIITAREERASIACASNANFSEWGQTFTDPRLAAAIVDRLTFRGHIINTGTDSYRLKTTRQTQKR